MPERSGTKGLFALNAAIVVAFAAVVAWGAWELYLGWASRIGPEQPIPFSHRVHVTTKDIDCRYCHSGVDQQRIAGLPPLQRCMGCHQSIITEHPMIRRLTGFYERGEPIHWVRVFDLADHVGFTHRVHVFRDIQCERCHGDVGQMDRLQAPSAFQMGFCVDCHRANRAPDDCWTCHR